MMKVLLSTRAYPFFGVIRESEDEMMRREVENAFGSSTCFV
jgi:hypothetical protein